MRSCYASSWRVWRNSDQAVKGRYYRVRHDARGVPLVPVYNGVSHLDSATWWDNNFRLQQPALGEVLDSARTWDNGAPPILPPDPITVGSADCLANGEDIASALDLNSPLRFQSWPTACGFAQPIDIFGTWADVYRCRVQLFWAECLYALDKPDIPLLQELITRKFPDAVFTHHAQAGLFPACFTVTHADYSIAGISPTQNAEQALVEVIQTIIPPTNQGNFSTASVWWQQANRVLNFLDDDGADPDKPVLFVGHSYGGASAEIASAIARFARPRRVIRWLTYGAPRIGDQRLKDLVDLPTRGCSLVNQGDIIGSIPPSLADIATLQPIFGLNLLPWARWLSPREVWVLNQDGTVEENATPTLATRDLSDLIAHVFATGTLFGIPAHAIDAYVFRLLKRCPPALFADGVIGLNVFRGEIRLNLPLPRGRVALEGFFGAKDGLRLGVPRGEVAIADFRWPLLGLYGPEVPALADGALQLRTQRGLVGMKGKPVVAGELGLRGESLLGGLGLNQQPNITGLVGLTGDVLPHGRVGLNGEEMLPFASGRVMLSARPIAHGGVGLVASSAAELLGLVAPVVANCNLGLGASIADGAIALAELERKGALALRGDSPRSPAGRVALTSLRVPADGARIGLYAPVPSSPIAITFLNGNFGSGTSLSYSVTTAAGVLLVATGTRDSIAVTGVTFNGVGMSLVASDDSATTHQKIWALTVTAGTHNVVVSTGSSGAILSDAYNVTGGAGTLDVSSTSHGSGGATYSTGTTGTTSAASTVALASFCIINPAISWTWGGTPSFSGIDNQNSGTLTLTTGTATRSSAGTYTATIHIDFGPPGDWAGVVVVYK